MGSPKSVRAALATSLATALVGPAGCALPFFGGARASDEPKPPVIQVRDYRGAGTVAVLGWDAEETAYGLRAQVGRRGRISGGYQLGDHRLYMSTTLVRQMGGFYRASVPTGALLFSMGTTSDPQACYRTRTCAPMAVTSVSLPDELLRQSGDSLVVTFVSRWGHDWSLTLHRDLIEPYLRAVDSVAVARRTR